MIESGGVVILDFRFWTSAPFDLLRLRSVQVAQGKKPLSRTILD
ncbi:hypothetical protein GXM_04084 [Nostoc sphaeroides CCNUC1]|uniref:Uncharacterized protein n=1 Tax=Nostoc sphaeroides CCNUC1 TaxID=2653204 RepID=A0A5P8W1M6_9NOSO|nr:hypothetical protein GXM_04084 [Nostoc sphaeroides CCNUC1]